MSDPIGKALASMLYGEAVWVRCTPGVDKGMDEESHGVFMVWSTWDIWRWISAVRWQSMESAKSASGKSS